LEDESVKMQELSARLAAIDRSSGVEGLKEAKRIIAELQSMNMRWSIPELDRYLKGRQRELFN
jgi:hypothetical protein